MLRELPSTIDGRDKNSAEHPRKEWIRRDNAPLPANRKQGEVNDCGQHRQLRIEIDAQQSVESKKEQGESADMKKWAEG